jgi:DNA-binding response OmpR family regulator
MMTHPDELLTRDRLLDAVWGWDYPTGTRTVDTRVAELRRALGDDPSEPDYIEHAPVDVAELLEEVVAVARSLEPRTAS